MLFLELDDSLSLGSSHVVMDGATMIIDFKVKEMHDNAGRH